MSIHPEDQEILRVYTVNEAAQILGRHPHTLRRWGNAGRLREYRTAGTDRQRLYLADDVEAEARRARTLAQAKKLLAELTTTPPPHILARAGWAT